MATPMIDTTNQTQKHTTKMVAATSTIGAALISHARDMPAVHGVLNHVRLIPLKRAVGAAVVTRRHDNHLSLLSAIRCLASLHDDHRNLRRPLSDARGAEDFKAMTRPQLDTALCGISAVYASGDVMLTAL